MSPSPLGNALPGLYQEEPVASASGAAGPNLALRLAAAFDELLAPVFSSLDNLDAYLDPELAPPDFLEWLGGWIGVEPDENWPLERRRALVLSAVELYRWRGTARGLGQAVEILTGADAEIVDNGGVAWSLEPQRTLPGSPEPHVTVRLRADDLATIDAPRLDALIAASKPAHVPATVEAVAT